MYFFFLHRVWNTHYVGGHLRYRSDCNYHRYRPLLQSDERTIREKKRNWELVSFSREQQIPFNPLRPNSDLSQTSHCNIKGLSVREGVRIENTITQVQFY